MDYCDLVEATYRLRWAGQKDGERTRERALRCNLHLSLGDPLSPQQVSELRSRLLTDERLSPGSVNRHLAAYFGVWRYALQAGLVQQVPPGGMYLREPKGRVRVVTESEFKKLLTVLDAPQVNAVGTTIYDPSNFGGLTRFLWHTGCRVGEALKLKWEDLQFGPVEWTATFTDTKNSDSRTVPLNSMAAQVASKDSQWSGRGPGPFSGISQSGYNRAWSVARMEMQLDGDGEFVPHALRHTYATRVIAAGVPLAVVARLMGHRDIKTTLRYTHLSTQDCAGALKAAGVL